MKKLLPALLATVLLAGAGLWAYEWYRLKPLTLPGPPPVFRASMDGPESVVFQPGQYLVAEVQALEDEPFAYLMFDYLRSRPMLKGVEVLLTYREQETRLAYPILLHLPNNLLTAIPLLKELSARNWIPGFEWRYVDLSTLMAMRRQTEIFVTAYNLPRARKLERLTERELVNYIRRFIRFKSMTDGRVRRQNEDAPSPLTRDEAEQLAEDILTIARFYDLPIEFFLGIGAMENNYLNVRGDIGNTIWKPRPEKGDIVLRRKGGRVLVLNEASGVWQVTQETLRYAHRLYKRDKERDYSKLPPHLRPPEDLNVREVSPSLLTTYAGLFLRNLLDRFDGDVTRAVGAYNGGPGNPNMQYAEGAEQVARHARRFMEQAALLHGPVGR
jgi:hypothetical protein